MQVCEVKTLKLPQWQKSVCKNRSSSLNVAVKTQADCGISGLPDKKEMD